MATVTFTKGDQVMVCSKEEGFPGSYHEGTVLKQLGPNSYVVQYKNLVEEDDDSWPLVEVVPDEDSRTTPPRIHFGGGFGLYNKVDVFANDGRWVGRITERKGSAYYVYFASTGEEIAYHSSLLRIRLDWVNGNWVSSKKRTPAFHT
ncbi:hypothetical protein Tsubulata_012712 [Turnera subulata]|uniref:Agenet domain-containing protein n=1 Tax=Turnera subulata TaxID=218843 RepID=A0A9Q0GEQ1_9ROSI|nr:hypothetical protein Tsubulata_012712 [Turnera subulata]